MNSSEMDGWKLASRIEEWDSGILTGAINGAIKLQIKQIFQHLPHLSYYWDRYNLDPFVDFVINFASLNRFSCYPGQRFVGLTLLDQRDRLVTGQLALKVVLCNYIIDVFQQPFEGPNINLKCLKNYRQYLSSRRKFITLFRWIIALVIRTLLLFNDFYFLSTGKGRRLTDHLFGLKATSDSDRKQSQFSETTARYAVWQISFRVLYFLLPIVVRARLFEKLKMLIFKGTYKRDARIEPEGAVLNCPECKHHPVMPCRVGPCGHIYCYVCIYEKLDKFSQYFCTRCFSEIDKYTLL